MNARSYPAVVVATAAFAVCLGMTPLTTMGFSTGGSPVPDTAPVQLPRDIEEILKLARAKVSDDVTVAYIQTGNRRYNLTASEILYLRDEGVSDRVLAAMLSQPQDSPALQQATPPATASAPQYVADYNSTPQTSTYQTAPSTTYVVQESVPYYYSSYYYPYYPYYSYYYPYYSWYPWFSIGFAFGWGYNYGCYPSYYNCGKPYYNGGYCGNNYNNSSSSSYQGIQKGSRGGQSQSQGTVARSGRGTGNGNPTSTWTRNGNSGGLNRSVSGVGPSGNKTSNFGGRNQSVASASRSTGNPGNANRTTTWTRSGNPAGQNRAAVSPVARSQSNPGGIRPGNQTGGRISPVNRGGQNQAFSSGSRPVQGGNRATYSPSGNSGNFSGGYRGGNNFASASRSSFAPSGGSRGGGFSGASRGGMSSGGMSRGGGGMGGGRGR